MTKSSVSAANRHTLYGSHLAVEFIKLADRFAHHVLIGEAGPSWWPILESAEGGSDSHCPPSPALQQLHRSRIESEENRGEAIMLVGGAGANHWSACVSVDETTNAFTFDLACRSRGPIVWLGSTYRLANGVRAELFEGRVWLTTGNSRIALTVLSATGDAATDAAALRLGPNSIEILAAAPISGDATTSRWRYSIEHFEGC